MTAPVEVIRAPEPASVLLDRTRLEILGHLAEPDSASGLARRMEIPRQRVNYHLRALEKAGFLELVEERRKGNCTERVMRATARRYLISPEALGALGGRGPTAQDRFSAAHLVAAAARTIRDVAILTRRAARENKRLSTLSLEVKVRFRNPRDRSAFAEELAESLAKLVERYHDEEAPKGRWFRFTVGAAPAVGDEDEADDGSAKME